MSNQFAEQFKTAMEPLAKGLTICLAEDGFELLETQSGYDSIYGPENSDIGPNNPYRTEVFDCISVCYLGVPKSPKVATNNNLVPIG